MHETCHLARLWLSQKTRALSVSPKKERQNERKPRLLFKYHRKNESTFETLWLAGKKERKKSELSHQNSIDNMRRHGFS